MKFVADLHIHSHYSRATSKDLNFEQLTKWAQLKGVQVVGSGDIAHPGWLAEMKAKLEPAEEGLFRLKEEFAAPLRKEVPPACRGEVRFMLAGEISNIYKKNDKVRKIHNVVFLPSFAAVEKLQAELEKIGNIRSDGRPILGLDARDLLEIVLQTDPQAHFIPAHVWTPWFSLFGSKSGFDSIEECFEDLTPHIFALETGLSSDPPMNWRWSALDRYTLVSNSDAHSPQKLAREANVFHCELSYPAIFTALQSGDPRQFGGTIEFFPEEGKYHYDGHRKCEIRWDPQTTLTHQGICPKCGKPVTVGVMHRVELLADREEGERPENRPPFTSLIPLPEVLGEVYGVGAASNRVAQGYEHLLARLGSELFILQDAPLEDLEKIAGTRLAEGIRRVRAGEVQLAAGYDGEYGTIKLFEEGEKEVFAAQLDLFGAKTPRLGGSEGEPEPARPKSSPPADFFSSPPQPQADQEAPDSPQTPLSTPQPVRVSEPEAAAQYYGNPAAPEETGSRETPHQPDSQNPLFAGLNPEQREAVLCTDAPLIILAGPGTGKTRTLTHRIAYLVSEKEVAPENILAITFTNKAAEEMAGRLASLLDSQVAKQVTVKTFHAFGALILRGEGEAVGIPGRFTILAEEDRHALLKEIYPGLAEQEIAQFLEYISAVKNKLIAPESPLVESLYPPREARLPVGQGSSAQEPRFAEVYRGYESALRAQRAVDYDGLIMQPIRLFESFPDILEQYRQRYRWISVDEYQDINYAQYRLLRLLAGGGANLCVIGDPDQAIYGFRGANREYFLKFREDFPAARAFTLTRNYRSTRNILAASRQVIAQKAETGAIDLWSDIISKTRLEIYAAPTHKAEAEYVVHQVERMVGGTSYFSLDSGRVDGGEEDAAGRSFSDFAVLYRVGALGYFLEEAFQRSGIPFQTAGQTVLYRRKEIRELLACLWLIHHPGSVFHLQKISPQRRPALPALLELNGAAEHPPITELIERIERFIAESGGEKAGAKRAELLRKLAQRAQPFGDRLGDFLESTVLQKETDEYDPRADRVALLSLHASKGLEFPVVFIIGCEEGLIPYQRKDKPADPEEERRLFYVGMTRAQEKLILTHARKRFLFGEMQQNPPSRFLSDIETALKEYQKMQGAKKPPKAKPGDKQLKLF